MNYTSFSTKRFGKLSDMIFQLFYNGRYNDCINIIENLLLNIVGDLQELGFETLLIYNHCKVVNGQFHLNINQVIPLPPDRKLLQCLFEQQLIEEKVHVEKHKNNPFLTQPVFLNKAILAAKIGLETNCIDAIETGTFLGSSAYIFSGCFLKVDTIEASEEFYNSSKNWLSRVIHASDISSHLGDSASLLKLVLTKSFNKKLIFLDAHYSGGITSKTFGICPLIAELNAIKEAKVDSTVVIDDIRCMGMPGYPTISDIISLIPRGKNVSLQHDQMIITD